MGDAVGEKAYGCSMRIDHVLEQLRQQADDMRRQIDQARLQCEQAQADLAAGNPYEEEVEALSAALRAIDQEINNKEAGSP